MTTCALCGQLLPEEPVRHWQTLNPAGPACGTNGGLVTIHRDRVDCEACKLTTAWKEPP